MSRPPPPPGAPPGPPSFRPLPPPARIIAVAVPPPAPAPTPPSLPPPSTVPTSPLSLSVPRLPAVQQPVDSDNDWSDHDERETLADHDGRDFDQSAAQNAYEDMLAVNTEQMYIDDNEEDEENDVDVEPVQVQVPRTPPPPLPTTPPPAVPPPVAVAIPVPPPVAAAPVATPPPPRAYTPVLPSEPVVVDEPEGGADDLGAGTQVWIADVAQVWVSVTIAEKKSKDADSKVYYFRRSPNAPKEEIDFASAPLYRLNPTIMPDMTSLHHIHEPGILYNLKGRFLTQNLPYTFMASAMIAVNPLRACQEPSMYTYVNEPINKVAPHPFSIAEAAYQNLCFSRTNQSIVISGVSGAGKTETAKIILRYLAARSPESSSSVTGPVRAIPTGRGGNPSASAPASVVLHKVEGLDAKLVDSSPLLESFGNAKTLRNNNSSRFGKFLKLCFSNGTAPGAATPNANSGATGMTLIGALVETYLLEKNRVITQGEGECNFHIFYILMMSHRAQNLHLKHGDVFSILSEHSMYMFSQVKEAASIAAIEAALETLGLGAAQIDGIWRVLAGILHLSNIVFVPEENSEGTAAKIDNDSILHLKYAAELWGLEPHIIRNLLSKREVTTRGESYLVQYTPTEANFARDATCKSIYESLFSYIVKNVNRSLVALDKGTSNPSVDLSSQYFVGVLDIFGFENFSHNGFEQLLINYANEALQNTFNEQLFEKELDLFRAESIDFAVSDCPNNRACVGLIAGRNSSIFKTLDSISRQPKPSDERFCEELHKAFAQDGKAHFLPVHRKDMRTKFCIKHYAGDVTYNVGGGGSSTAGASNSKVGVRGSVTGSAPADTTFLSSGWISKNNDSVPDALCYLFTESKLKEFRALNSLTQEGANLDLSSAAGANASIPARRKSVMMKPTIVAIFSKSMDDLNALLLSTTCQFVRCIKPNEAMLPGEFNNSYVMEQIRSLGILQACEVLKVSLPTRITYAQLKTSLADVIKKVSHLFGADSEVVLIACLLRAFNISPDLYRLGRTMVFFRPGQLARLEAVLNRGGANNNGTSNGKEQQNSDIIKRIEESHAINQKGLQLTRKLEITLSECILQVTELDKKFDRLNQRSRNLPEVRSLDIPEDVVQKIALIQSFLNTTQRKHQSLMIKLMSQTATVEDPKTNLTEESRQELVRQCKVCAAEVSALEVLIVEAQQGYAAMNEQITSLEEQCGGVSNLFNESVERNDVLYEKIQEDRNNYEVTLIKAKEQAERCQLDRVEHFAAQCADLHRAMAGNMADLQRGINVALVELDKFEGAGDNVDFSRVSALAVTIVNKLDHTQRGLVRTEGTIAQLEKSVKTAKAAGATSSTTGSAPAPRPSISVPETSGGGGSAAGSVNGDAERRTSVNFSAKDLAQLRKKKQDEVAGDRAAASASTAAQGAALLQELDVADDSLPPDWVEKTDKKSGRLYYVNEVTKARQWKRPQREPVAKLVVSTVAAQEESDGESSALPPGWKELVDKKTGRAYYVNSETKEKQWRRPANDRRSARLAGSPVKASEETVMEQIKQNNRASRRLKGKVAPAYLVEGEGVSMSAKSAAKVAAARRSSMRLLESDNVEEEFKNTVSYMCRIGAEHKKGFLMKQGKFIGRWKRRHFVLTDDLLEYWDRVQDYALGKDGKTFFLSGACQTAYTSTQNCFCVSNPNDPNEANSWYLLADSESDMLDWMSAINAHIHMRYLAEWHITTDFWERGNVETSFWKMPASALKGVQRRPVGIRSLPINDGPRTGEGIYPGEIVEVVQILEQPADKHVWAQRFLRLSDDRGWVVENHPKANYAILVPVAGQLVEDETLRFVYSADCLEDLEVYNSPNCDEDHLTGLTLHPGSIIRAVAVWTTTTRDVSATIEPNEDGSFEEGQEFEEIAFVKMAEGRGWVPIYHPITGGEILTQVSAKSAVTPVQTGVVTSKSSSAAPTLTRTLSIAGAPVGVSGGGGVSVKTSQPFADTSGSAASVKTSTTSTPAGVRPPPPPAAASGGGSVASTSTSASKVSSSVKAKSKAPADKEGSENTIKEKEKDKEKERARPVAPPAPPAPPAAPSSSAASTAVTPTGASAKVKKSASSESASGEKKSSKTATSSSITLAAVTATKSKAGAPAVAPPVSVVSSRLTTKLSVPVMDAPSGATAAEVPSDKPKRRPVKDK